MSIWSYEEEINSVFMKKPHVVLLGAGASYAALPNGDKYGKKLPLLNNFVEVLELESILKTYEINKNYDDFELIYSDIVSDSNLQELKKIVEKKIYNYFSDLKLPDYPTIYDYLILSLREKDVIATFNWDPFLTQAVYRNLEFIKKPPLILFLHGNVTYKYCESCKIGYPSQSFCQKCGTKLKQAPLLYPIKQKNYQQNKVIMSHWKALQQALKSAYLFTIFGYSAPKSDVEAISLLKNAWGDVESRELEQIEIIDIKSEEELIKVWEPFIHTHHYDIRNNFFDSWIAQFPRRSCEAAWSQFMEVKWLDFKEFPKNYSFKELYEYLTPKLDIEYS
jgi:NAD-dependent SIR2 family protein deacetylase